MTAIFRVGGKLGWFVRSEPEVPPAAIVRGNWASERRVVSLSDSERTHNRKSLHTFTPSRNLAECVKCDFQEEIPGRGNRGFREKWRVSLKSSAEPLSGSFRIAAVGSGILHTVEIGWILMRLGELTM